MTDTDPLEAGEESQIDLARLLAGDVDYLCTLGDAMIDCGISSFHYNKDGQIAEVAMRVEKPR